MSMFTFQDIAKRDVLDEIEDDEEPDDGEEEDLVVDRAQFASVGNNSTSLKNVGIIWELNIIYPFQKHWHSLCYGLRTNFYLSFSKTFA